MMKRYVVFAGSVYYPGGGASDFRGDFDTVEEALRWLDESSPFMEKFKWWQIVDSFTFDIVKESS